LSVNDRLFAACLCGKIRIFLDRIIRAGVGARPGDCGGPMTRVRLSFWGAVAIVFGNGLRAKETGKRITPQM
jgi:hypothetical protein